MKVHFSDTSTLRQFVEDPAYAQTKSYSASDRKGFVRDALGEARRMRRSLRRGAEEGPGLSSPAARLEAHHVSREEMVGIEHLVEEKPGSIQRRRRAHSKVLLTEQARRAKEGIDDGQHLAYLSRIFSKRPASQARKRAVLLTEQARLAKKGIDDGQHLIHLPGILSKRPASPVMLTEQARQAKEKIDDGRHPACLSGIRSQRPSSQARKRAAKAA